ncbi:MAG: endopeptidase La [Bacilli bacterium]|nr:endopeptidase La [Bacilli bacterium]
MIKTNLPVLFIKNHEIFPYCETKLEFSDTNIKKTISLAESYFDNCVFIVHQKSNDNLENLKTINVGIIAKIKLKIDMPNGNMRINLKGLKRAIIHEIIEEDNLYEASLSLVNKEEIDPIEEIAMSRTLYKSLDTYIKETETTLFDSAKDIRDINKLTDIIVSLLPLNHNRKLKYLKEVSSVTRLKMLLDDLEYELSIIGIEKEIDLKVNKKIDDSQREFYLKEKLSVIKEELHENALDEITILENKINNLSAPKGIKKRLEIELNRFKSCNSNSPEVGIIRNYIDILLNLPWNKSSEENFDINSIKEILENNHFGLQETKTRILEYIMVKHYTNQKNVPTLCLVGPPGVGKTSIALSIADALNLKSVKISVGGVNDEAEIIGHRRTYVGAAPGKIMSSIQKIGVNNPVFIIDEVDKMTKDIKGDPASALLEVLDKGQNNRFVDHFIDEEFDLSKVMFILTANYIDQIPKELRDRMEIIELGSYTEYEKIKIARDYMIPQLEKEYLLESGEVSLTNKTLTNIIRFYTKESGVRELERVIRKIYRKYICNKLESKKKLDPNKNLENIIGIPKYRVNNNTENLKGVVTGLSYTPYGGDTLKIEVISYPGENNIKITGLVGDVMEESINVAFGYLKGNYQEYNLDIDFINSQTFQIHIPSNAVKKDGPSAGITVATSILSYLKNQVISNTISMSGEITLTGNILKIGGVKEKIIAAIDNNIELIYMPKANMEEVLELEYLYKNKLKIKYVSNYQEIYEELFRENEK